MDPEPVDPPLYPTRPALYTNYLQAAASAREIVIEFGMYHNGEETPRIHTSLITHPAYLEEFLKVMMEALNDYRAKKSCAAPESRSVQ
jgi:hypothetical protein